MSVTFNPFTSQLDFGGGSGGGGTVTTSDPLTGDGSVGDPITLPTTATPQVAGLGVGTAGVSDTLAFNTGGTISTVSGDLNLSPASNGILANFATFQATGFGVGTAAVVDLVSFADGSFLGYDSQNTGKFVITPVGDLVISAPTSNKSIRLTTASGGNVFLDPAQPTVDFNTQGSTQVGAVGGDASVAGFYVGNVTALLDSHLLLGGLNLDGTSGQGTIAVSGADLTLSATFGGGIHLTPDSGLVTVTGAVTAADFIGNSLSRDSGDLTLSTTTSGDLILNPAGSLKIGSNTGLATFSGAITNLTVVNGIVTAAS